MICAIILLCYQILTVLCSEHLKFEYKYSFKGPYLAQKDGTVPFWEHFGNAIASEEMVRITPSLRSKKGSIWTKSKTNFDWWQVEIVFRVNGRGRLGADGFAFWFTENKGVEGPVFGSNDHWNGLGVFFDSFDNDGKGNNPYIMAMYNDGSKAFDHPSDGLNQQLAGCQRDFRNKPFPVKAKIEYYKNVLTILFHNGNTNNDDDFELCLRAENIYLPQNGFFGLSAATGGLADDHDALKFLAYSMYPPGTQPTHNMGDAEKEKFSKEYEEYKEKLEKQKEEYRKEHPDEAKRKDMEFNPDELYESTQQRELQQIFQGQSSIFEILRALHRKLDEVIGRQERSLSMLTAVQQTGGISQGQGMPPPQGGGGAGFGRHEVEALLGGQREIVQSSRDIKSFVTDILQRTGTIITMQNEKGKPVTGGLSYELNTILQEIKDSLNSVKIDLSNMAASANKANPCPLVQPTNCVTLSYFLIFMGIQLVVIIGYFTYQSSKESQAKKFY